MARRATGEANIAAAVEKLEGDLVRTRDQGLDDLRRIFGSGRTSSRVDELTDNALHNILESLFRIVRTEKPNYVRAARSNSRTTSASRLKNVASALWVVIEAVGDRLKQKTASAVLDHILGVLPEVSGGFCTPIEGDYLKCFEFLLSYAPRGEHLRPRQWQVYVDFITSHINDGLQHGTDDRDRDLPRHNLSARSTPDMSMSLRLSEPVTVTTSIQRSDSQMEEIVQLERLLMSLKYLTNITNAPILSRLGPVLDLAVYWLENVSRAEELAFEVLNNVLPIALVEDVGLAANVLNKVMQIIRQRDLWTQRGRRPPRLRECILATLTLSRDMFLSTAWEPPLVPVSLMEQLLDIMRSDYEGRAEKDRRAEKERLQIEDLTFNPDAKGLPFALMGIHMMSDSNRAVNAWSTLSTMAFLLIGIAKRRSRTDRGSDDEMSNKRRKLEDPIEDLIEAAATSNGKDQLVALQLALFVVDQQNSLSDRAVEYLSLIDLGEMDDEPVNASWTFLLLARISLFKQSQCSMQHDYWKKVWSWTCRACASSSVSRPACFLLYVLTQSTTTRTAVSSRLICEGIFPDGASGPSSLTDASILLLTGVLSSGLLDNEKSFKYFASRSLKWFDGQWTISSAPDRQQNLQANAQTALFARSENLCAFFISTIGDKAIVRRPNNETRTGSISNALLVNTEVLGITKYMLSDEIESYEHSRSPNSKISSTYHPSATVSKNMSQLAWALLEGKVKAFLSVCKSTMERPSSMNFDVIKIISTACVLCSLVAQRLENEVESRSLKNQVQPLWEAVHDFLLQQPPDNFYQVFTKIAARVTGFEICDSRKQSTLCTFRTELATSLGEALKQNAASSQDKRIGLDFDITNSQNLRPSQNSQSRPSQASIDTTRSDLSLSSSGQSSFSRQCLLLRLDLAQSQAVKSPQIYYSTLVIDAVTSLEPEEILATRDIILQFLEDEPALRRQDAARLLTRLAHVCLQRDDLERCEVALCLCLRVATFLVPMWIIDEDDDLSNVGWDVYGWYIDTALGKNVASQRVLLSIASLLDKVLHYNSSYGTDSLPSARSSLLQILQSSQTGTKFGLKNQLANIFNGYVLGEHAAVFADIIDSLPSDPDQLEGIAVRLYLIGCLGSQWRTVLRQSVYHVFEIAANIDAITKVAQKSVKMICRAVELESPKDLMLLFSPQVLYTWLESGSIESIPFRAFGYENLPSLLVDVQDEIVSQVAMRDSTEHAQKVVQYLGTSWDSLIERWFAKCLSYAVIADVSVRRSSREIGKAETSLVQHLGEEFYARLARENCAQAVSTLFLRMSDDRGFEKSQSQSDSSQSYETAYKTICGRSSSEMELPPAQQPSFRAKHLVQMLDRICTRAQETLETIWTPALLVHVYRVLLSDAKPSFGPLHMAAVLRKIRIAVCLAGPVALSGYPLQMMLHSLRPFLTQFHSSQDAFGVFWYLLENGKPYLKSKLPFVTGLSVAVFASLSKFASSSQESTTQESHFISTMSKTQEFRLWLGHYLEDFSTASIENEGISTFTDIVQAAKQVTDAGSSSKTTAEGSLLYHLLADQASKQPLLSDIFFRLTLRSLCHDFKPCTDLHDDILYNDDDVLKIAPVLWSVINHQNLQEPFRVWVSLALGRAYSLQGPSIIEFDLYDRADSTISGKTDVINEDSYRSIVNMLTDLLWEEDNIFAGAAEATLQCMFSALAPADKLNVLGTTVDQSMFDELRFSSLSCPTLYKATVEDLDLGATDDVRDGKMWAASITRRLSRQQNKDPILSYLPALIKVVPSLAAEILPFVAHLALFFEARADKGTEVKDLLTSLFEQTFDDSKVFSREHVELALKTVVYLRRCQLPHESTMAKRNAWLAVDFTAASKAAIQSDLYRTALLMLEVSVSQQTLASSRGSRRPSHGKSDDNSTALAQIYRNLDDPDFFYGTHEELDVASVVEKLCHEGHGYKALSFQSALFDSNIRIGGTNYALGVSGSTTMSALSLANFSGLSSSIGAFMSGEHPAIDAAQNLQVSLNLHQWDVAQEGNSSDHGSNITSALRTLSSISQREAIVVAVSDSTSNLSRLLVRNVRRGAQQTSYWASLAVLAELKETLSTQGFDDLELLVQKQNKRRPWTEQESFESVEPILLSREAVFATIKNSPQLRGMMDVSAAQAMLLEIKSLRSSLNLGHVHEMSQFCLNRAAYLSALLPSATELGVKVEAAIQYDLANTFWAQHETSRSIRILQNLYERDLPDQAIEVRKSEILTDLGSKITEARLDRPDEVTAKYLIPAIKAIGNEIMGSKVGRVFHNFASFCDSQLRDPDNVDEYERVEKIRDRKLQEVLELESMYKKGDSRTRDTVKAHYSKAKTWFKLDDEELQRLKAHRDRLIRSCLENYLLSLRACEDFPNDVLRFLALWMEQSTVPAANASVSKHLSSVPTYKFAPLMNQLSSRILTEDSTFQHLLLDLMYHICEDHPFHSLYQIFATSKSKGAQKDEVANSRHAAATKLSDKIMRKSTAGNLWISIHNSNIQFVRVAQEKIPDKELKTGSKLQLRKLAQGAKLEQTIHEMHQKIPPPTMKVDIRPDKNYSSVPTIAKFDPQISIAGGVSAPKIITVVAVDGSRHKMLLKGGNDDLRQDSIMEQVFEQVSNLLKDHRATRQRRLGIRTYKVIPLTHNAGIIEFVKDTMPLHDYILPAHTRYYPKDYKPNKCRKEIADAQAKSLSQRLQAYRNVTSNFHPVMRFFFMEHFLDPDDWFQKRLNYSRSTAAISMLGHVLGLGDRHGHNILLDTKTGEAVHIDLGVAFEAGRVLPVPEVVPFRLTRDLVDGMGLSGVEGVFRRCCNFTLEALRQNQEAIMTILDVLRWDPLYSWSVSPLRLARMQENQEQAAAANNNTNADGTATTTTGGATVGGDTGVSISTNADGVPKRSSTNEPSEADRALAIVSKKLGKSLSVEATVNELIRQAMDERNLAVLYCGWAAYA